MEEETDLGSMNIWTEMEVPKFHEGEIGLDCAEEQITDFEAGGESWANGGLVTGVIPGSIAADAGVTVGMALINFNDAPLTPNKTWTEIQDEISDTPKPWRFVFAESHLDLRPGARLYFQEEAEEEVSKSLADLERQHEKFLEARRLLEAGEFNKAVKAYEEIMKLNPLERSEAEGMAEYARQAETDRKMTGLPPGTPLEKVQAVRHAQASGRTTPSVRAATEKQATPAEAMAKLGVQPGEIDLGGGGHHKKHRRRKPSRRKSTRRKSTRRKTKKRKSTRRKSRRKSC